VGLEAYQLYFLIHSKILPILHVSFLNKVIGTKCQIETSIPELDDEGSIWLQLQVVLDQREHRLHK
jgi:hypothetical protein